MVARPATHSHERRAAAGDMSTTLMAPSFSPAFRLAAACARWPPSDRRTEAIHAAAGGLLDWQRFLRVARRHAPGATSAPRPRPSCFADGFWGRPFLHG